MNLKKIILSLTFFSLVGCTTGDYQLKENSISFKPSNSSLNKTESLEVSSTSKIDSSTSNQSSSSQIVSSLEKIDSTSSTSSKNVIYEGVLSDLGPLMETPIKFDNDGWIIKSVDGKYGFVGTSGEIIVEPKYSDLFFLPSKGEGKTVGYLYNSKYDWENDARLPKNYVESENEVPWGIGWARGNTVFLNEEGNIIYCDVTGEKEIPASSYYGIISDKESIYTVHSFGIDKENHSFEDYYVYIPKFDYIDGPYPYTHELSFLYQLSKSMDPSRYNQWAGSSVVLAQENGYGIYSLEQNALLTSFDWVHSLDLNSFGGKKGDNFYVYSKDLDLLYKAGIEEGSSSIGNTTIIKEGNEWKVVTLDFLEKNYPVSNDWEPSKIPDAIHSKTTQVINEDIQLTPGLYRTKVNLKVRSGPSQSFSQVGSKSSNQLIQVTDFQMDDEGLIWGKLWEDIWICLINQDEIYCDKESIDNLTVQELEPVIIDHYNWLLNPKEPYSVLAELKSNGQIYSGIIRSSENTVSNEGIFKVEINMVNGEISDEKDFDSWKIK